MDLYRVHVHAHVTDTRNAEMRRLLTLADVLVDGPYIEELRTLDAPWRGSRNQRLIDVQRSLTEGRRIEWEAKT